jgi:hypothetical protein
MLRFNALVLAGVFTVSTAMAAADPSLLGLVMPDAKVVTGIEVSQSQASPFGQYVLSQMQLGTNFDKLATAIGFDPRRDLQEIVAAAAAADVQGPSQGSEQAQTGLILARGVFQPAKIAAVASLAGAAVSTYKGFEILGNSGSGKNSGVVFLDSSTVATGDVFSLKALIDRRISGAVFSGPLAQTAFAASAANDAWFATATPSAFLAGKLPGLSSGGSNSGGLNPVMLLQSVIATSGGVKFASSVVTASVEAVTNTSQDAQALADVLRFLTSMVQMNRNNNPGGGKVASLADSATFTATGSVMHLTVSLPEQQLEQLLMPAPGAAKAKKVAFAR